MTTLLNEGRLEETAEVAPAADSSAEPPLTVIRHQPGWRGIRFGELWQYRELLYFLAWRDVKVRYKQTALGALWAILQPLLMAGVFTIVLGRIPGVSSAGVPYPLFAFIGFAAWMFFSRGVTAAAGSLLQSQALLTKVYFPRLAVPFASVGAPLVDLAVTIPMVWMLMAYYGWPIGSGTLLVPVIIFVMLLAALGVGTLLAALSVAYRDFKHTLPFLVQIWMFATPAIYMELQPHVPAQTVAQAADKAAIQSATANDNRKNAGEESPERKSTPSRLARIFEWNPVTGLVRGLRSAFLNQPFDVTGLAYSTGASVLAFFAGALYFRRVERRFADIL